MQAFTESRSGINGEVCTYTPKVNRRPAGAEEKRRHRSRLETRDAMPSEKCVLPVTQELQKAEGDVLFFHFKLSSSFMRNDQCRHTKVDP